MQQPDTLALRSVREAFPDSILDVPAALPDAGASASWADSPYLSLLVVACTLAVVLLLSPVIHATPAAFSSFLRVRNCKDVEGSVRLSRDRNITAILFIVPFVMLHSRFRIYDPGWMESWTPEAHFLGTLGVFGLYILIRFLLFITLSPRRHREDAHTLAHRFSLSAFILLAILLPAVTGILLVFGANDLTVKWIIIHIDILFFGLYCFQKAQIFALSCNPFTTFLYLCALEFLPTVFLAVSASV